jgi:hypothetical protein
MIQTSQVLTAETPRRREIPKTVFAPVSAPSGFSFGFSVAARIQTLKGAEEAESGRNLARI